MCGLVLPQLGAELFALAGSFAAKGGSFQFAFLQTISIRSRVRSDVTKMFSRQWTSKLDAFGVQDCGLTGDSCGQPLFSHKPSYWFKSTARMSADMRKSMTHQM